MLPAAPLVIFLLVLVAVVLSVLYQDEIVTIPILNIKYSVKFYNPPLIGVGILVLLTPLYGSLTGWDIWIGGIAGNGSIFPYQIMIQFETLAIVCIALDMTGALAYLAMKAIQKAGSSGRKLYLYLYFLDSAFTIVTSNDIVILTLTPIIFYCTKVVKISPYPFLFSQFFTANICSMVLVIGNPVNLIVAYANNLSFTAYSNWMAAPAIVGCITNGLVIYILFHKDINVTFEPPTLRPELCLKDKRGTAFHGCVLLLTRLFLGVSGKIGAAGWIICAVAAACSLIYNQIFWQWDIKKNIPESPVKSLELHSPTKSTSKSQPLTPENEYLAAHVEDVLIAASQLQRSSMGSMSMSDLTDKDAAEKRQQLEILSQDTQKKFAENDAPEGEPDEVRVDEPTAKACIMNTPWEVLPFLFGMFTLVNALAIYGWIDALSTQILSVIPADEGNSMRAIAISTFLMTTISFFFCMIMNNQPASILLAQVLIAPAFNKIPSMVRTAGMLGVLEGANVGSCWSLIGGLCGILWSTILRNKGIKIGYLHFSKMGFMVMPFVTFMVSLIIWAEAVGNS